MLLVVIGLSSFPFAAEDTLLWLSWLIVIAAVVLMAYVFISMNRDRILSLLAGDYTRQIQLDRGLYHAPAYLWADTYSWST